MKQRKHVVDEPSLDANAAISNARALQASSSLDTVKARIAQVRQRASLPPFAIDEVELLLSFTLRLIVNRPHYQRTK